MTDQFISVDEAREAILGAIRPLGEARCLLSNALGRRLAEVVAAPADAPAFDNSAMDGFGFRFVDRDRPLDIVGESAAGHPYADVVGAGQAVRIMTGAAVPAGVDTVAMREVCTEAAGVLRVDASVVHEHDHIRRRGTYVRVGEPVMQTGALIRPAELGLLASFGRTVVTVFRQPRVGVLTTGSELVEPDRVLGEGQIYNSNAYMLEGLIRDAGCEPIVAPIIEDDAEATRAAVRDLDATVDLLITVGGVSVGDYDFVRQILDEESGGMMFWKVRMKPGKPLAFGVLGTKRVPVVGLPGNPVSSFVGFHQFVRPALAVMQGAAAHEVLPRTLVLRTAAEIRSTPHRREYILGHVEGSGEEAQFRPHPGISSGNVFSMHNSDAFAVVAEGVDHIACGDAVRVELL